MLQLSALKGTGLAEFWQAVTRFRDLQAAGGQLRQRRHAQDQAWMWERIEAGLRQRFRQHPAVRAALPSITARRARRPPGRVGGGAPPARPDALTN